MLFSKFTVALLRLGLTAQYHLSLSQQLTATVVLSTVALLRQKTRYRLEIVLK
jgi:hypothetical protein